MNKTPNERPAPLTMLAPALLDSKKGEKKEKKLTVIILIIMILITILKFRATTATDIQIHHFNTTLMCLRSIAGVPFDSVGRLRAAL